MKLSKSETLLIQILIVMVVIAVSFFLFLSPLMNSIKSHELSMITSSAELANVNMTIEQAKESKPLMDSLKQATIEQAKQIYPLLANVEVDDELMNLAYQNNVLMTSLLIEDYQVAKSETEEEQDESLVLPGVVKQATITLEGEVSDFYRFIDAVNNYSKSMVIASLVVDDSTDKKAEIVLYFMQADMSAIQ